MDLARGYMGVAEILRERAAGEYGFDEPGNSALAAFIAERAGIGAGMAEALVWGEAASPTADALAKIADVFALDPDLLSILLTPASPDVVEHVLSNVVLGALNTEGCEVCYDLEAAILGTGELAGEGETEIALTALSHLIRIEATEEVEDDPEDHDVRALLAAASGLDRQGRQRVLAFALAEATDLYADESAVLLRALSRLRQGIFSRLLNAVFDQIAVTADGAMDEEALAHRLNLSDPHQLRSLPEMVSEAIAKLPESVALVEPPLLIEVGSGGCLYRLGAGVQTVWISLLEAERSPLLISRPAV